MNNARRKAIAKIAEKLDDLKFEFEALKDEEQEAFDNMPEGIQSSERGEAMETIIYNMEEVLESLESAVDGMNSLEE